MAPAMGLSTALSAANGRVRRLPGSLRQQRYQPAILAATHFCSAPPSHPALGSYQKTVLRGEREMNPAEHSVFGAAAGAVTGLVTTPLDVLKTRLMLDGAKGED